MVEVNELLEQVRRRHANVGICNVCLSVACMDSLCFVRGLIAGQVSAGLQSSVSNGRYLVFQTSEFSPDHPVGVVRRKLTHRRLAPAQAPVSASTA
jgi:hypothetical protein